jgi:SAM-dependent methyltransferase
MSECKICANSVGNRLHKAREMMMGTRKEFSYVECAKCGCLQINLIPKSMNCYYPSNYMPFAKWNFSSNNLFKRIFREKTARHFLGVQTISGRFLSRFRKKPEFYDWLSKSGVSLGSRILDFGCGSGGLLRLLKREGFKHLLGIDEFYRDEPGSNSEVEILKIELRDVVDQFDLIILNHSLEHMPDHFGVLRELHRLLADKGCLIIRMPLVGLYAWNKYGTNWGQMDPPRHLLIHSLKSINILAEKTAFEIREIFFDSWEFQFLSSEQYLKDIPLIDPKSYFENPAGSIFSKGEVEKFRAMSLELNKKSEGDQACFFLHKR